MLVLSRQAGEAIVIDDEIVVTVALFTAEFMEIAVTNLAGGLLETRATRRHEWFPLPHGGRGIMIEALAQKVRIGLEFPADARVRREDHRESSHDIQ